ncbi:MAG: hypothetical protein ACREFP_01290 [Acetobacteraceae bacterium]
MPPYPNPRASWPSGDDNAVFNLLIILAGLCVAGYLLWANYHGTISAFVIDVMRHEVGLFGRLTDRYAAIGDRLAATDPSRLTLQELYGITRTVGVIFRIPAVVFIALLAILCFLRAAPSRYRRAFDLDGLIREQAASFPIAAAFACRRLRLVAPEVAAPRPADYALTLDEWVQCHALDAGGRFEEARARAALVAQLGPRWTGPQAASPVARFLFVVFALHFAGSRNDALALLGRASAAFPEPVRDQPAGPEDALQLPPEVIAEIDRRLESPAAFEAAQVVAGRHAYTATALMGLLNTARLRSGVLAPGQFAWLKLVDRNLWYALHSLGYESEGIGRYLHPNPRIEAAGVRDHWAAEREANGPLVRSDIERALEAVRRAASAQAVRPVRS